MPSRFSRPLKDWDVCKSLLSGMANVGCEVQRQSYCGIRASTKCDRSFRRQKRESIRTFVRHLGAGNAMPAAHSTSRRGPWVRCATGGAWKRPRSPRPRAGTTVPIRELERWRAPAKSEDDRPLPLCTQNRARNHESRQSNVHTPWYGRLEGRLRRHRNMPHARKPTPCGLDPPIGQGKHPKHRGRLQGGTLKPQKGAQRRLERGAAIALPVRGPSQRRRRPCPGPLCATPKTRG